MEGGLTEGRLLFCLGKCYKQVWIYFFSRESSLPTPTSNILEGESCKLNCIPEQTSRDSRTVHWYLCVQGVFRVYKTPRKEEFKES